MPYTKAKRHTNNGVTPCPPPKAGRLRSKIFYWFGIILMLKWKLLEFGFVQQHRPSPNGEGKEGEVIKQIM